jgi:hypothetical protein
MLRRRTAPAFAAVVLLGLFAASRSDAFCRTTTCETCQQPAGGCVLEGVPLYWPVTCVTYDVQQDASKYADFPTANEIADLSFHVWLDNVICPDTGQPPSFSLLNLGGVACDKHEYNDQQQTYGGNANVIVFRDDSWTASPDPHTLALTTVTYNKNTGEIYDADIEVNSHIQLGSIGGGISTSSPVPGNSFDLQSILTHEAGHFLGLAHSDKGCPSLAECPSMDAMYRTGSDDFRTLDKDDIEGICTVYPAGRPANENSCAPRHGLSRECGVAGHKGCCSTAPGAASSRGAAGMVAALMGFVVFAARGRRRRA